MLQWNTTFPKKTILRTTIMWTKKSNKGHQEWEKAYIKAGIPSKILKVPMKTCVASLVVLFQETIKYADAIIKHILSLTLIIIPSTCTKWLDLGHYICYYKKIWILMRKLIKVWLVLNYLCFHALWCPQKKFLCF